MVSTHEKKLESYFQCTKEILAEGTLVLLHLHLALLWWLISISYSSRLSPLQCPSIQAVGTVLFELNTGRTDSKRYRLKKRYTASLVS